MTASGPFALGPTAMSRTQPTHPAVPAPRASGSATKVDKGKAKEVEVKREREKEERGEDEKEVYSDPEEGVEIVDMGDVKHLDWMAPDSLPRNQTARKRQKEGETKREGSHQAGILFCFPRRILYLMTIQISNILREMRSTLRTLSTLAKVRKKTSWKTSLGTLSKRPIGMKYGHPNPSSLVLMSSIR